MADGIFAAQQVCLNGTCVVNPLKINPLAFSHIPQPTGNDFGYNTGPYPKVPTSGLHGNVTVKFGDAYIDHNDNFLNKGDPYVKFFVASRLIGKTVTSHNTYYPKFKETFSFKPLTKMDILKFEVWNENTGRDEYIFSIAISCDEVMTKRLNRRMKTHYSGLVNKLALAITCEGF